MDEREPKEEITLERHVWRTFGISMALESVRILANGWDAANGTEAVEHLILGIAIPAWYIWGQGVGNSLRAGSGIEVEEKEWNDWLVKDIKALVGYLGRSGKK